MIDEPTPRRDLVRLVDAHRSEVARQLREVTGAGCCSRRSSHKRCTTRSIASRGMPRTRLGEEAVGVRDDPEDFKDVGRKDGE